jgi:hypothetical protein
MVVVVVVQGLMAVEEAAIIHTFLFLVMVVEVLFGLPVLARVVVALLVGPKMDPQVAQALSLSLSGN